MPASATDSIQIVLYAWFTTFGYVLGLVTALCGYLVLGWLEAGRQAAEPECGEPETDLMEVSQPLEPTQSVWVCCGDCYARLLLRQVPLPGHEVSPYRLPGSPGLGEPISPLWVDDGEHPAQNAPDSQKNRHERSLRVEQGERMGRVTLLSY